MPFTIDPFQDVSFLLLKDIPRCYFLFTFRQVASIGIHDDTTFV